MLQRINKTQLVAIVSVVLATGCSAPPKITNNKNAAESAFKVKEQRAIKPIPAASDNHPARSDQRTDAVPAQGPRIRRSYKSIDQRINTDDAINTTEIIKI